MSRQPSAALPGAPRLLWSAEPPRSTARPAAAEGDLIEAIGQLRGMLDAQLAHVNHHLVRIGSLIVQPSATSAPPASSERTRLAAYCLGPFRLAVDGEPIGTWRSSKALALFQYMIGRRRQLVSRDALIEALWGNSDALAVNTSLKVAVHALRQALQQEVGQGGRLEIVTSGSGYRLEAEGLWVDVEEFERSFALGRSLEAAGHGVEALALFGAAAGLYQGDFLQDVDLDWVTYRRESLRDQFLYVVGRLARAALAAGEYQDAIARCQQVLAQDPCHEETYRLLMLCHARLGQRGRVRSWFELCARTLRSELDCTPEAETERIYRLALAGRA
jgi:two-component SAPR family response regulator